jgi:hypothetical protein
MKEKVYKIEYKMRFPTLRPSKNEIMIVSGMETRAQAIQEAYDRVGKIRILNIDLIDIK